QAGYLYIQLRDFKRGDRKSEIMQPIAAQFERDDMLAIAEYLSQKPWPDLGQPRAAKDVAAKAQSASASVGCPACHLDRFQGDGTVPRLAGMGRDYLAKTIADFRTRPRGAGGVSRGAVSGTKVARRSGCISPACGQANSIWQKNFVVPDKRSEAERRSGTHNHRIWFGEDSWSFARAATAPWGWVP
ncbi:c-type cytochrome, partial [Escherichia coli]|uniref:c-type cytochrome n=1 Tax=Escherichia coli TaxID=562 RepID=UPI003D77F0AE